MMHNTKYMWSTKHLKKRSREVRRRKREEPRPYFTVSEELYVSAGVVFFTEYEGQTHYMLQRITKPDGWDYEDFGGKSQYGDKSIKDVALREAQEELNGKISTEYIKMQMTDPRSHSKGHFMYMAYFVYVPPSFLQTDLKQFGTCGDVERTIEWVTDLQNVLLHPRLARMIPSAPIPIEQPRS